MKIKIFHFHNGSGGGVLSVIKNLIKFSTNEQIENHIIYTINPTLIPDFQMPAVENVISQQVFYYNSKNNFYHTCKCLAKLLPDEKSIVVAHDWLELGMMSNLGLQNPVVHFLHGDYEYYYNLANKHKDSIDKFITVAQSIRDKLERIIPSRSSDIKYLRFPVPEAINNRVSKIKLVNVIFIGRLSSQKGYDILPDIAFKAMQNNMKLSWHIIGTEETAAVTRNKWPVGVSTCFYGTIDNNEVRELLSKMDFFILPSYAEGMPVSLVEAMKAGVVPLVNDLEGGISELVINNETGFKIIKNNVEEYIEKFNDLLANSNLYKRLQENCTCRANLLFNSERNTAAIENIFLKLYSELKKNKVAFKAYGSRLDNKYLPNLLIARVRSIDLK